MSNEHWAIARLIYVARRKREFCAVYGKERGNIEYASHPEEVAGHHDIRMAQHYLKIALAYGREHGRTAADFMAYLKPFVSFCLGSA